MIKRCNQQTQCVKGPICRFPFQSKAHCIANFRPHTFTLNKSPWEAFQKVALVAYPFHSLVVEVLKNLLPYLPLPYPALVVQAKQVAATEHTYSAVNREQISTIRGKKTPKTGSKTLLRLGAPTLRSDSISKTRASSS